MLRTKLFKWFAALVIAFGLISAFIAVRLIEHGVVKEAQTRVISDLRGARTYQKGKLSEIQVALELAADEQLIIDACAEKPLRDRELRARLETVRRALQLDFLTVVQSDAKVIARAAPPYNEGDSLSQSKVLNRALKGNAVTGMALMSPGELEQEGKDLSERAFIELHETPHAAPSTQREERRGLVLVSAVPVRSENHVSGAIYGGILLNRNYPMVDSIRDVVFKDEEYEGRAAGTVTIFLSDSRIATTVRLEDGTRALGTRVSQEVSESVLRDGKRWEGRAFVVRDWYLTAYEPIADIEGDIIGMFYVGLLERPYRDLVKNTIYKYIILSLFVLILALVLAFFLASRIARPLHLLAEAAKKMNDGKPFQPVAYKSASTETQVLITSFNDMVETLVEREDNLQKTNKELEKANRDLEVLNYDYMEAVGFVSHELKSPLAAMLNYVYLMLGRKFGPLTEKQSHYMNNINENVRRLLDMVRNYLNLSRIEQGVLTPARTEVNLGEDIITPLCDTFREVAERRAMVLTVDVDPRLVVAADLNMIREVFENLVSNAIKYGCDGGTIKITVEESGDFLQCRVFNDGEGIPEEKQKSLFKKFSRINEGDRTHRGQKGTGLGLFITKHIVEAHGGRIEIESQPGKGVEVLFTLPMKEE